LFAFCLRLVSSPSNKGWNCSKKFLVCQGGEEK